VCTPQYSVPQRNLEPVWLDSPLRTLKSLTKAQRKSSKEILVATWVRQVHGLPRPQSKIVSLTLIC
jgi:hypothetical protein